MSGWDVFIKHTAWHLGVDPAAAPHFGSYHWVRILGDEAYLVQPFSSRNWHDPELDGLIELMRWESRSSLRSGPLETAG